MSHFDMHFVLTSEEHGLGVVGQLEDVCVRVLHGHPPALHGAGAHLHLGVLQRGRLLGRDRLR